MRTRCAVGAMLWNHIKCRIIIIQLTWAPSEYFSLSFLVSFWCGPIHSLFISVDKYFNTSYVHECKCSPFPPSPSASMNLLWKFNCRRRYQNRCLQVLLSIESDLVLRKSPHPRLEWTFSVIAKPILRISIHKHVNCEGTRDALMRGSFYQH